MLLNNAHARLKGLFTEPEGKNCFSIITLLLLNSVVNIYNILMLKPFCFSCSDYLYQRKELVSTII